MENTSQGLRIERLGQLIRENRKKNHLTLEQAFHESGISPATLSRLERWKDAAAPSEEGTDTTKGSPEPDTRTLAAVCRWLGVSLDSVIAPETTTPLRRLGETTPDVITAHLRADRNLSAEAAEALGHMFRVAYQQFAAPSPERDKTEEQSL